MPLISNLFKYLNRASQGNLNKVGRGPQHQLNQTEKRDILERQRYLCVGEGCKERHGKRLDINMSNCQFDHIVPRALGGSNSLDNIQALCPNCHFKKTKKDLKMINNSKTQ